MKDGALLILPARRLMSISICTPGSPAHILTPFIFRCTSFWADRERRACWFLIKSFIITQFPTIRAAGRCFTAIPGAGANILQLLSNGKMAAHRLLYRALKQECASG